MKDSMCKHWPCVEFTDPSEAVNVYAMCVCAIFTSVKKLKIIISKRNASLVWQIVTSSDAVVCEHHECHLRGEEKKKKKKREKATTMKE